MRRITFAAAILFSTGAAICGAWAQTPLTGTTGPAGSSPPGGSTPPSSAAFAPATGPATAAPAATGQPPAAPARAHRRRATLQQRFDEANTTHDGHLTQEQARSHMPAVARDFAAIDTGNKGYVTMDDIRAHAGARRAARRAARAQ